MDTKGTTPTWLTSALVQIQTHLDEDLGLTALATPIGRSQWHVTRRFSALLGESPRQHVERLRLERAAMMLMTRRASVLQVALDCGYGAPETFSRAFTRRFGLSPTVWRRDAARRIPASVDTAFRTLPGGVDGLEHGGLSATRLRTLLPLQVLFIRHQGPYDNVPTSL